MRKEQIMLIGILGITFVLIAGCIGGDDNGGNGGGPISGPDVTLELTSNKTTYTEGEDVYLDYRITNNEDTEISLSQYEISVVLETGPSEGYAVFQLFQSLAPGETVNGTFKVDHELKIGENTFEITLCELEEGHLLRHQCKKLVITVE